MLSFDSELTVLYIVQEVFTLVLQSLSWILTVYHVFQDETPKDKTDKRRRPKLSPTLFGQPTETGADPEPKDAREWEIEDSDSDWWIVIQHRD